MNLVISLAFMRFTSLGFQAYHLRLAFNVSHLLPASTHCSVRPLTFIPHAPASTHCSVRPLTVQFDHSPSLLPASTHSPSLLVAFLRFLANSPLLSQSVFNSLGGFHATQASFTKRKSGSFGHFVHPASSVSVAQVFFRRLSLGLWQSSLISVQGVPASTCVSGFTFMHFYHFGHFRFISAFRSTHRLWFCCVQAL